MDQRIFSECAQSEGRDVAIGLAQACGGFWCATQGAAIGALVWLARRARSTGATCLNLCPDDVVSGSKAKRFGADGYHDAGHLVAHDHRQWSATIDCGQRIVRVAQTSCSNLHEHFCSCWIIDGHIFDLKT